MVTFDKRIHNPWHNFKKMRGLLNEIDPSQLFLHWPDQGQYMNVNSACQNEALVANTEMTSYGLRIRVYLLKWQSRI